MNIIGLNNEMIISSAALLQDGEITAAVAEERIIREKQTRKFPLKSIEYCLKEQNLTIDDIDCFVNSWNPGTYFQKYNPIFSSNRRHLVEQLYSVPDNVMGLYNREKVNYIKQELYLSDKKVNFYYIDHHMAHAANGFFQSNFDNAAIMTSDSQGEFESITLSRGVDIDIFRIKNYDFPQSIGLYYKSFTEYLGFKPNSDEWKVMALGAYSNHDNKYYSLIKNNIIKFLDCGEFEIDISYFSSFIHEQPNEFSEKLEKLLGERRYPNEKLTESHFQIAAAMQKVVEDLVSHILTWLHSEVGSENLVLSGGFFMNSVLNGKLSLISPFKNIFISSAPDDSGNSFGSAFYLYHSILRKPRKKIAHHNYLGPSFTNDEIRDTLNLYKLKYDYSSNIEKDTAKHLADNKIVGWFQGRMEFGQRALGNRSIIANPTDKNMKEKINKAVKFREEFRPFAPAILEEKQFIYFDMNSSVPFMEKVFPVKKEYHDLIPAVVHKDGSGRVQSVSQYTNKRFHNLIKEFEKITDIPVVLNTSFNLNGEAIVCTPTDAIKTFISSGLDILVLGDYIIKKN